MFSVFLFLSRSSLRDSDYHYKPDIGLGMVKKSDSCPKAITENGLFSAHIRAKVKGQPIFIYDTYATHRPLVLSLSDRRLIAGVRKGMVGACEGEIRRLTIPPNLAYLDKSVDGLFPAGSTWIAEIEVIEIQDNEII